MRYYLKCDLLSGKCRFVSFGDSFADVEFGLFAHMADEHREELNALSFKDKMVMIERMQKLLAHRFAGARSKWRV